MKTIIPIFVVPLVLRCSPLVPEPPVDPDAGTAEDCDAACANLARLQCPGWEGSSGADEQYGTEDDISCVEVCEELLEEPTMTLYPLCTSKATSCEQVEKCFD
ncbi:MAG: hypothetical protein GY854_02145 [Deltaproteobacteria bacterium]|nr:hypothetical protein [Deltaproteobacteria bacterium]